MASNKLTSMNQPAKITIRNFAQVQIPWLDFFQYTFPLFRLEPRLKGFIKPNAPKPPINLGGIKEDSDQEQQLYNMEMEVFKIHQKMYFEGISKAETEKVSLCSFIRMMTLADQLKDEMTMEGEAFQQAYEANDPDRMWKAIVEKCKLGHKFAFDTLAVSLTHLLKAPKMSATPTRDNIAQFEKRTYETYEHIKVQWLAYNAQATAKLDDRDSKIILAFIEQLVVANMLVGYAGISDRIRTDIANPMLNIKQPSTFKEAAAISLNYTLQSDEDVYDRMPQANPKAAFDAVAAPATTDTAKPSRKVAALIAQFNTPVAMATALLAERKGKDHKENKTPGRVKTAAKAINDRKQFTNKDKRPKCGVDGWKVLDKDTKWCDTHARWGAHSSKECKQKDFPPSALVTVAIQGDCEDPEGPPIVHSMAFLGA